MIQLRRFVSLRSLLVDELMSEDSQLLHELKFSLFSLFLCEGQYLDYTTPMNDDVR
jgi:hypothetical protein